jgi:uncharacterized membrane-anchored protein
MRRYFILFVLVLFGATPVAAKDFSGMFPDLSDIDPELRTGLEKLDYRQGEITVGDAIATFDIGEDYYFLGPDDSNTGLGDMWGNPPGEAPRGMIFRADTTPFHVDAWGLAITFEDIGYVSDEDANDYEYNELLATMQADTREESKQRVANGYGAIELVGWAEPPHYDRTSRKLYWAQELKFDEDAEHTLNYAIRALGRKGVLVMNFIAPMTALSEVRAATPDVLAMSNFTDGNRYSDFNPSLDKVAAIGIGGLIAGKVVAKTGLLLGLLFAFKKFAFLLLLPLAWVWRKFTGKRDQEES